MIAIKNITFLIGASASYNAIFLVKHFRKDVKVNAIDEFLKWIGEYEIKPHRKSNEKDVATIYRYLLTLIILKHKYIDD